MESNKEIYRLLPLVAADVGVVGKTNKNQQQGYNFRGIDSVIDAVHGALTRHGVTVLPEIIEQSREERPTKSGGVMITTLAKIKYSFVAPDGSAVTSVVMGEGSDTGDKSSNKAMSAALKYVLGQVLTIPFSFDDADQDSPQLPAKPKDNIHRCSGCGTISLGAAESECADCKAKPRGGPAKPPATKPAVPPAPVNPPSTTAAEQAAAIRCTREAFTRKGYKTREEVFDFCEKCVGRTVQEWTDMTLQELDHVRRTVDLAKRDEREAA